LPAKVFARTGVFPGQRFGQMNLAVPGGKVVSMKAFCFSQVVAQLGVKGFGKKC
jgi:hypothetical protein